jgi:uncharacterized protein YqgC (DUF456 family)
MRLRARQCVHSRAKILAGSAGTGYSHRTMTAALAIGLAILTILLIVASIVSCIVPPLPGPVVAYCALVSYELIPNVEGFSVWTYVIWGVVVAAVTVADFIFPPAVTRKFGGTGAAVWGGALGAIAGLFFAPFGIILGPLLGAVIGDLIGGNRFRAALKSGVGSFIGFVVATGAKVAVCIGIGFVVLGSGLVEIFKA